MSADTHTADTRTADTRTADTRTADRVEIAELFARLANLLDEHRHDDAHTVYTDDVVVRSPRGGELHGLDEVTAYLRRSRVEGEHTQHVHGDVLVDVDGDHAKATASELTYFYRDGEPPYRTSGLRESCTAVRTPAGWRFSDIRIMLAWLDEK
ncbi:nuclear transport factor 2 family protein [Streptomyces sp. NPDC057137]|uniref:nuclear transport factor 2 family protein n=1 Tax=Streptomyces sp. NPDC057137 TaxID=3346030 RepID=UPI003634F508